MDNMVKNIPDYAYDRAFIVARECGDELWFWGAFDDLAKAYEVAVMVGGVVINR